MLRLRWACRAAGVFSLVWLSGCQEVKNVEIVNPCDRPIEVNLWETPRPAGDENDTPTKVRVPPRSLVTEKDALADVGEDGSSAEVVSGPGKGEVIFMPHDERIAILPGELCGDPSLEP